MNQRLTQCIMTVAAGIVMLAVPAAAKDESSSEYFHYRLGMKYKVEKQYDKAVEEFRKVLAEYPDDYNVYLHIAEIRNIQNQPGLAIPNLKQALAYNPGWSKAHKMLAEAYVKDGQPQKAVVEYQQFQQSCDPKERDSVQKVIDRLVAKIGPLPITADTSTNPYKEAATPEKRPGTEQSDNAAPGPREKPVPQGAGKAPTQKIAPQDLPDNQPARDAFSLALHYYDAKEYDSSLTHLRNVLVLQPGFKGAYYYAGLIRFLRGEDQLAAINFGKAQGYVDPEYTGLFYRAKIYGKAGNYSEAIRLLSHYGNQTVSEQGRKEAAALRARYRELLGDKYKKTAARDSTPAQSEAEPIAEPLMFEVRIDSLLSMVTGDTLSDAGRKLLAGIREFQAGSFDNAVREFKKVLIANPSGPIAAQCLYNSGICYFKLRLFKEAENQFQQIIDRYPRDELAGQSLFLKALSYFERKESAVAERLFRSFLQTRGSHAWEGKAWEKLGDAYLDLDEPKKAIDAFSQVCVKSSGPADQVNALFKMGTTYMSLGNATRALAHFDSAIAKGERHSLYLRVPDSYYRNADLRYKARDYAGALEYYTKAARKYPSYQETPWGLFQIGNIHKSREEYQNAIDAYKDLMKRFPEDYWARQAGWKLDDAVWQHEYRSTLR